MNFISEIEKFTKLSLPVKLHLGCGSNLFESYINVEGDYCAGQAGIVIHNLTENYPIPNNCIDEILNVHVIEHIMPDQVLPMLKEWHRILKPNGIVAIEWPDLLKMCTYIVQDPTRIYSENKKILKRGVAGIFGNIARYQDTAMLHKWGYSADSMIKILKDAGFRKAVIEKNCYAKTEMDSRVVAYK